MTITIALDAETINSLDLSAVKEKISNLPTDKAVTNYEQQLKFVINYKQEAEDPRELSEIAEIRLWFVCLDANYPWLPFLLDWRSGELARYTAMLVPHQFSRSEGIIYNPEALEIYVMHKIFVLSIWCQQRGISSTSRLKSFAKLFGYDIDDSFFESIKAV
ncbi:conserved hypothetical protein [Hyella patelloides LEGE 07179]|uniref:CRR6 family NdhI maturation factor n=1 Tax=Hyella patelloides LEGE 07179 TaxID=945734 RepID=A0A563W524_9CYAN|nr:CRR6 family NdhI maturation factor [Hyella patelloides]VEP18809.1 conserved hypothetical protein [Hyella patelloides LEGE 07179]